MEHPVGPYRLDILARDPSDRAIAIENQVEPADHAHLGQLLLYAAHVNAATAVWISPRFRDEQRQALIWLNENTVDGVRFFGVELSIVRIGASPPAPTYFSVAFTRERRLRVEVYLDLGDQVPTKAFFDELLGERERWESELGFTLEWERLGQIRASRIATYRDFWIPGSADEEVATAATWTADRIIKLISVTEPFLRKRGAELRASA